MLYYAAPMEGITTYIYRRAHARWYGGIDKYFTPFIAGRKMTVRERRDILPENNTGVLLVPQILANKTADFLCIAERVASYGYDTVNLNLGCPSGTVTAKKRGAGFLSDPDALDAFLYEIYSKCPLKISIKTRLGVADLQEWERLLAIYAQYPVEELIVHTRLLQEFYTGRTHPEAYAQAVKILGNTKIPLCYNGDITSMESWQSVLTSLLNAGININKPTNTQQTICCSMETSNTYGMGHVMIGRGLLRNPALVHQLRSVQSSPLASQRNVAVSGTDSMEYDPLQILRAFHDEILDGYRQIMSGDLPVLFKMKDLWTYMICCFTASDTASCYPSSNSETYGANTALRHLKKIRKADRLSEYTIAVDHLFREFRSL